jgi:hypothetical protein
MKKPNSIQLHALRDGRYRLAVRDRNGRWSGVVVTTQALHQLFGLTLWDGKTGSCVQIDLKASGDVVGSFPTRISYQACRCQGRVRQVNVELNQ